MFRHIAGLQALSLTLLRNVSSLSLTAPAVLPFDYYTHNQTTPPLSESGQSASGVPLPLPILARAHSFGVPVGDYAQFTSVDVLEDDRGENNNIKDFGVSSDGFEHHPLLSNTPNNNNSNNNNNNPGVLGQWAQSIGSALMSLPASASFGYIDLQPQENNDHELIGIGNPSM